jgi:hypothetical protein
MPALYWGYNNFIDNFVTNTVNKCVARLASEYQNEAQVSLFFALTVPPEPKVSAAYTDHSLIISCKNSKKQRGGVPEAPLARCF